MPTLAEEKLLIPKGSLAGEEKGLVTPGTLAAVILLGSLGGRVGGGKIRAGVAWGVLTALGGLIMGVPIDCVLGLLVVTPVPLGLKSSEVSELSPVSPVPARGSKSSSLRSSRVIVSNLVTGASKFISLSAWESIAESSDTSNL